MKRIFLVVGLVAGLPATMGQVTLTNINSHIEVTNGGILYIEGGAWFKGDTARVNNDGTIILTNHPDPGTEDWINDASDSLLSGIGTVRLEADGPQNITGQFSTTFHNLELDGSGNQTKSLVGVNAYVTGQLVLNDEYLDVQDNMLVILNDDPASLARSGPLTAPYTNNTIEGTIISTSTDPNKGFFGRAVREGETYLFPWGGDVAGSNPLFVPIKLTINTLKGSNIRYTKLVYNTPLIENLDTSRKDTMIDKIWTDWYVKIHAGDDTTEKEEVITLYAVKTDNFLFEGIVQWRHDFPAFPEGNPPAWTANSFIKDSAVVVVDDTDPNNLVAISNTFIRNYTGSTATPNFTLSDVIFRIVEPIVFVPTLFSPNGDGVNDVLYVRGQLNSLKFVVYDRWGNKLFETTDQTLGWDGTVNGKPVNNGIYAYYLEAELANGELVKQQGYVVLAR